MNWLEVVPGDFVINRFRSSDHAVSEITKLNIEDVQLPQELSPLSQFFLGAALLGPNHIYSTIPLADESSLQVLKNDVCVHYEVNQKLQSPNGVEITMHKAKTTSIQKLLEMNTLNIIDPVVKDLFLRKPTDKQREYGTVYYKINKNAISDVSVPGFDLAWMFISSSYKLNGGFSLSPIGWTLSRELPNSIAIAYISHRCNDLVLAVDRNQDVISLEILF